MKIRTVQWNIGGGKLLRDGADPTLLGSYTEDGLETIIAFLREQSPDIITLQETHAKDGVNQAQQIAEALGYPSWVNDEWAESHVEAGFRLGQGIVSRFPLKDHTFALFTNPNFEVVWENGTIAHSHDKGRSRCHVAIWGDRTLIIQTLHTVPFRRFNIPIDSEPAKQVLDDMGSKLATQENGIIQADFNLNFPSLLDSFPPLVAAHYQEIPLPATTTPKDEYYDHVLYKGLRPLSCIVVDSLKTDHYPVVTEFELTSE